jgi:hypothetical protein
MKTSFFAFAAALSAAVPAFASDAPKASSCEACCGETECASVVAAYDKVSAALADDDLAAAQAAAATLACCLKCEDQPELAAKVDAFAKAGSLADARTAFKAISAAFVPLAEKAGADCFIMTCPMAGADWVQTSATVANPYYGSEMLRCGSIKKKVKGSS